jgi:hypothetical protein
MPEFSSTKDASAKVTLSEDFNLLTAVSIVINGVSGMKPIRYNTGSKEPLAQWLYISAALCPLFHPTGYRGVKS